MEGGKLSILPGSVLLSAMCPALYGQKNMVSCTPLLFRSFHVLDESKSHILGAMSMVPGLNLAHELSTAKCC